MDYEDDRRFSLLADRDGRTVKDFAFASSGFKIKDRFLQSHFDIGNNRISNAEIVSFCQERQLDECIPDVFVDWFPLLHAAISFGRLDFLRWIDQTFSRRRVSSLPSQLAELQEVGPQFLPVFCHPGIAPQRGDLLEVSCGFRTKTEDIVLESGRLVSPSILDGNWRVENWMPIDITGKEFADRCMQAYVVDWITRCSENSRWCQESA